MILVDNRGVCQMKNKKGFTLIELLAVIVILGLLMAIAIPSVTKYITESRKKTVVSTIGNYMSALSNDVNDLTYTFTGDNTIYAVPIECIALERGGSNPFGAWHQASNAYWAYVLVQYNDETSSYIYGYTFKDSAGYGLYPTSQAKLNEQGKQIQTGLELIKPTSGKVTNIASLDNWSGFLVDSTTNLVVLVAEKEGNTGNGVTTCTLQQKGNNYEDAISESVEVLEENVLMKASMVENSEATFFDSNYKRSEVEEIYTVSNQDVPEKAIDSWDVSATKNGKVTAWILDDDNDNLYELYIGANGRIIVNNDASFLFMYFTNTTKIDLSNFDTSNVMNMKGMFAYCYALASLDVSSFDTSKTLNMHGLFVECRSLKRLDISSFDTSKVVNMSQLFDRCKSLIELDLSSFDTSNVRNMAAMFSECISLSSLDLSDFDTSKVTNMAQMFYKCENLTTLNISNFNTTNVTDMSWMFSNCISLTSLDLSHFDTSNVKKIKCMFQTCENLIKLNISSFDISNVTDVAYMFNKCSKLTTLDIRNFDFTKVTEYKNMLNKVSSTSRIVVKDDTARNWIKANISSNYTNIVTVDEL